ncbi:MAG: FHA domain-containing protein [Isosphaerales bacterium]
MNRPPTRPVVPSSAKAGCWSLEVVRGREVGRGYAIEPGESILGNALNGERGLDLLEQEGSSPRRMAARHAVLSTTSEELTIRDLESPGGTFVNQQRLLSGQSRRLQPGDVVQLGSVQLRVKRDVFLTTPVKAQAAAAAGSTTTAPGRAPAAAAATPGASAKAPIAPAAKAPVGAAPGQSPPAPGRLPIPFAMAGGAQCRTWDDFLVLAAQRWQGLRDELTSGRLADYLRHIQRAELVPHAASDRSADDRLDEWLARLPVTKSSAPELDVHPESLLVKAATGGGVTRQSLRVTNVGYRLLKCTARVEPPGTPWVHLRPEHDGRPFQTIEQTELPIELELPETINRPLRALIVLESNGGTRRVEVRIERPDEQVVIPEAGAQAAVSEIPVWGRRLSRSLARLRPGVRIAAGCAGAIALRLLVLLMNALPIGGAGGPRWEPRLSSFAIVLAAGGVLAGLRLALVRGERQDMPAAGFAGGAIGLLTAALWFAVVQSVERVLGTRSSSIWALGLFWGAIGALFGLVSTILVPHRDDGPEVAP